MDNALEDLGRIKIDLNESIKFNGSCMDETKDPADREGKFL